VTFLLGLVLLALAVVLIWRALWWVVE